VYFLDIPKIVENTAVEELAAATVFVVVWLLVLIVRVRNQWANQRESKQLLVFLRFPLIQGVMIWRNLRKPRFPLMNIFHLILPLSSSSVVYSSDQENKKKKRRKKNFKKEKQWSFSNPISRSSALYQVSLAIFIRFPFRFFSFKIHSNGCFYLFYLSIFSIYSMMDRCLDRRTLWHKGVEWCLFAAIKQEPKY
jgi:hypothetical protein